MKRDLLKEAIADANILKNTAIANAKLSLEESITPHLQNMFSSKLQEMDKEEIEEEELNLDELISELEGVEEGKKEELKEEEEGEEVEAEEAEEEIDLENMTAEDLKDFVKGAVEELVADGEIDLEAGKTEEEETEVTEEVAEGMDDEEIDIDALLNEIKADKKADKKVEENKNKDKELKETLNTVVKLKETLNEVNLLNSKLLFVNKLFKEKSLTESQKSKVIDSLDKAKTPKDAKLIYETLKEVNYKQPIKESRLKLKGSASKLIENKVKETKIIAADPSVERMQKLAGLI